MSKTIKVAVAGVGNCAASLIEGVSFYKSNPNFQHGLTYQYIGGYSAEDIEFVVGFDIDMRKVNKPLSKALRMAPNCTMHISSDVSNVVPETAMVYRGPTLDGIPEHMRHLPQDITFVESPLTPITTEEYVKLLQDLDVDVLLNYMPVGANEASKFYIENAIRAKVHIVNCMPSYISTKEAKELEKLAIEYGVTIVGSDMRSAFGASRLSEVLQGSMLDSGLTVTQHIQMNMAANTTQGMENIITGRSANTDFLNMMEKSRLHDKHVSKENVLNGQNVVRDMSTAGMTMFAGPSLTVLQKPGSVYIGTDNKIANLDIVAYGWAGARYELTARLSVQDSPNSAGIVFDAIRFCIVASEELVVGYLRGPSAWSQKTPPLQMKTSDSKFECDALARRIITPLVEKQLWKNKPNVDDLQYTFQTSFTDYE